MARPLLTPEHPSMRAVGYRQAWAHLAGELTDEVFVQKGIEATRQLAKRQITWLRSFEHTAQVQGLDYQSADPCRLSLDQLITVCSASFGRA